MRTATGLLTLIAWSWLAAGLLAADPGNPAATDPTWPYLSPLRGLKLSAEQETKIAELREEYGAKIEAIDKTFKNLYARERFGDVAVANQKRDKLVQELQARIQALLTPEQRAQLKAEADARAEADAKLNAKASLASHLTFLNRLTLSAEQQAKIAELKKEYGPKLAAAERTIKELSGQDRITDRLRASEFAQHLIDEFCAKVRGLLTPAQKAKLNAPVPGPPVVPEPANAKPLQGETVPLNGPGACIASDGCIWADHGDFGLDRFDGKAWQNTTLGKKMSTGPHGEKMRIAPQSLIPAQNGCLLAFVAHRPGDLKVENGALVNRLMHSSYVLFDGQGYGANLDLVGLAAANRKLFLKAFSQPSSNRPFYNSYGQIFLERKSGGVMWQWTFLEYPGVVVDSQNIWVYSFGAVSVVGKKGVFDVPPPPASGDLPIDPPPQRHINVQDLQQADGQRLSSIALAGDGEYVLVRTCGMSSFFVRLTPDGKLEYHKGPSSSVLDRHPVPLRDLQGGLWLFIKERQANIRTVWRMTGPDQKQEFGDSGVPFAVDAAGCVWLLPRYVITPPRGGKYMVDIRGGRDTDRVAVWEPGGRTVTLNVPERKIDGVVVPAEKGRVFLQTTPCGIQEFVAKDPAHPADYTPGTLYHLPGIMDGEEVLDIQYSSLNFLVVISKKQGRNGGCFLHLFPLGSTRAASKESHRDADEGQATEEEPEKVTKPKPKPAEPKSTPPKPKLRTWTDATGDFSVEAEFVKVVAGMVTLRKANGAVLEVPLEKLSEADKNYIRHRGR